MGRRVESIIVVVVCFSLLVAMAKQEDIGNE